MKIISVRSISRIHWISVLLSLQLGLQIYQWLFLNRVMNVNAIWLIFISGIPSSLPIIIAAIAIYNIYKNSSWLFNILIINVIFEAETIINTCFYYFKYFSFVKSKIFLLPFWISNSITLLALIVLSLSLIFVVREQGKTTSSLNPLNQSDGILGPMNLIRFIALIEFIDFIRLYHLKTMSHFSIWQLFSNSNDFLFLVSFLVFFASPYFCKKWFNLAAWYFFLLQIPALLGIISLTIKGRLSFQYFQSPIIFAILLSILLARYLWKDRQRPIFPIFRG